METKEVVDGEEIKVIKTEPLAMVPIRGNNEFLEADIGKRKKNLAILLRIVAPGQLMQYGDEDKKSLYLTAGGADVALRAMGFRWGRKSVTVTKDEGGTTALAEADLLTPDGQYYEHFIGIRRMTFLAPGVVKGYIKNEPDLMRAALANMVHTAGMALLGLRMLTPADCGDVGIDLDKLERHVDFQDHSENKTGDEVSMAFGKEKGVPISSVTDDSLSWYIKVVSEGIDDPKKKKFRDSNQKKLNALKAEQAKRANAPAAAETKSGEFDYGPPPMDAREPGSEG